MIISEVARSLLKTNPNSINESIGGTSITGKAPAYDTALESMLPSYSKLRTCWG